VTNNITYLKREEIDNGRWDECIGTAPNGLIYSTSFFLDHTAPGWEALVYGEYEAVMPLTIGKKYGIRYLFQPPYLKQAGVIGPEVTPVLVDAFLQAVPSKYKLIDIDLHESNQTVQFSAYSSQRVNMLLDLQNNYSLVSEQYNRLARRMLKRAADENINIEVNGDIDRYMGFYHEHYQSVLKQPDNIYQRMTALFKDACVQGKGLCLAAYKEGELLGMYALLYDQRAVYSVLGGSSAKGKELGTFHLLTDYAIRHFAGSPRTFRFEGSDFPGIADFNKQFAPAVVHYTHLYISRMPLLLRWLK
jgi:hypothetical protein